MIAMNDSVVRQNRIAVSKHRIGRLCLVIFFTVAVFVRMLYAQYPFSFDYDAYISIITILGGLSFSDIFESNLLFPYTVVKGIIPVEFGFTLLVKMITILGFSPEVTYAIIASTSVGLRVFAMSLARVPVLWICWLNVYAITLFEANALRLGVAVSVLLFGLIKLHAKRKATAYLAILISLTFHLQVIFFVAPFAFFYFFSDWIGRSRWNFIATLIATIVAVAAGSSLFPIMNNEKLAVYISMGASESAGISVTSVLSTLFAGSASLALRKRRDPEADQQFFLIIVSSCVPSLVLLILLTNIAVVGDRAWQLAIIVLSTFFFSDWGSQKLKLIPLSILLATTLVMQANVTIRYPLSNFFSPPLPTADFVRN